MQRFDLVVIEPKKGKVGREVCTLSLHANNVTEAVKRARSDEFFGGSGYIVMQAHQFRMKSVPDDPPAHQEDEVIVPEAA